MHHKKLVFILLFSFVMVATISLFLRNVMLNYTVNRFLDLFHERYNASLTVGHASFRGLGLLNFSNINLITPYGDTMLNVNSIIVNPRYLKLLSGKVSYSDMVIDRFIVRLQSTDSVNNYSFFLSARKKQIKENENSIPAYGEKLNKMFSRTMDLITGNIVIRNFTFEFFSPENSRKYFIPDFASDGHHFACKVYNLSRDTITWKVDGNISKKTKGVNFRMTRESSSSSMVSFSGGEKSLKWLVDTLYFESSVESYHDNLMAIKFKGGFSNLQVNYWRISPEDVTVSSGYMDFKIKAGPDFISIDSTSDLSINRFRCKLDFDFRKNDDTHYAIRLNTGKIPSSSLFESLPKGMFNNLQGMKTRGEISYLLHFSLKRNSPDSLLFFSELKKHNFSIGQFGDEYLPRINEEFLYTAYDGERPVRSFLVGSSNPDFVSLNLISDYLKNAVMTSEDGSFYFHTGFNEEAFKQSIATNIKEGRFARGGSTISMQLVKNVFLSRNKTISRKLEEALIVWLIERNRLVTKERMFEVYLNIIEWGPDVYGIKEAARFYFSKQPDQLSLAESIFLASIIPHPKYFRYSFDKEGKLKPFLNGYYKLVSERMMRKNWITEEDLLQLVPEVKLNGPALNWVMPIDTIQPDSIPPFELNQIN